MEPSFQMSIAAKWHPISDEKNANSSISHEWAAEESAVARSLAAKVRTTREQAKCAKYNTRFLSLWIDNFAVMFLVLSDMNCHCTFRIHKKFASTISKRAEPE